ncbi:MAG TPA: VOC family protein [Kofleriaceae bacterium]|nr:VOC family protein [Kofleriaceae bacterium]
MASARLTHVLLFVSDVEKVAAFYEAAFGYRREASADAGFGFLRAAGGGADLALHVLSAPHAPVLASPPRWRSDTAMKLCFEVDDLAAARQAVLDAGGQARDPWSWDGSDFCELADVEGNPLQIIQRPPPRPQAVSAGT